MEQTDELSGVRIKTGDVGAFIAIAMRASQCEVARDSWSPMLLSDDVIYLKGQRQCGLWKVAVFTPFSGHLSNSLCDLSIH